MEYLRFDSERYIVKNLPFFSSLQYLNMYLFSRFKVILIFQLFNHDSVAIGSDVSKSGYLADKSRGESLVENKRPFHLQV